MVADSRLAAEDADAVIAREIGPFRGLGQDYEWKVHEHDGPSDPKDRLRAHGFQLLTLTRPFTFQVRRDQP